MQFAPVGACIYCGATDGLTKEHIIPYSLGGNWTLPKSSCHGCAKITGAFEGDFSRTILGPLRMLYNMPTRRPKARPAHLPLKVKYPNSSDWEIANVDRSVCPFLITLPLYAMPDIITGIATTVDSTAATTRFWLRGGGFWPNRDAHLQWLCDALGAVQVMPTGSVNTETFCLTIAKVAHSFLAGKLGLHAFEPTLSAMIRDRDTSKRARFIGGGEGSEPPSEHLHEIDVATGMCVDPSIIVVRVRLFAVLGTPTYHVFAGRKISAG